MIRFGSMRPVTERPYLSSSSRTVWPPTSVAPASLILLKPPSRMRRSEALSMPRAGKLQQFMAVSGRPPMAYTSEIELAAATCPKRNGSSTTGVM